jgi:hypothetical protein
VGPESTSHDKQSLHCKVGSSRVDGNAKDPSQGIIECRMAQPAVCQCAVVSTTSTAVWAFGRWLSCLLNMDLKECLQNAHDVTKHGKNLNEFLHAKA